MIYQMKITKRGRITIPKEIREILKLKGREKLNIDYNKKKNEIIVKLASN